MAPVGADRDRRALLDDAPRSIASTDADDPVAVEHVFLDCEDLTEFRAALDCGVREYFVEREPPGAIAPGDAVLNQMAGRERKVAGIEHDVDDGWRLRGD